MEKDYGENTEKEEKEEEERKKRQMAAIARKKCILRMNKFSKYRFGRERNFGKEKSHFFRKINFGQRKIFTCL
jgi:hypothetical protein